MHNQVKTAEPMLRMSENVDTSMVSKPQYSRASSSRGTSACSKRVVPHVFKMKRLLETNMLLSLWRFIQKKKTQCEMSA